MWNNWLMQLYSWSVHESNTIFMYRYQIRNTNTCVSWPRELGHSTLVKVVSYTWLIPTMLNSCSKMLYFCHIYNQVEALGLIDEWYIVWSIINWSMYTPHFLLSREAIVLLLASILLTVIVTAKLDCLPLHATDCTGKLPGELYITIIVRTCFGCVYF